MKAADSSLDMGLKRDAAADAKKGETDRGERERTERERREKCTLERERRGTDGEGEDDGNARKERKSVREPMGSREGGGRRGRRRGECKQKSSVHICGPRSEPGSKRSPKACALVVRHVAAAFLSRGMC